MKPILVLYATREGHARQVAERLAIATLARGLAAEILDAKHIPDEFRLDHYCAVIVTASVHGGTHEREIIQFVKRNLEALNRMPAAFLSVSLSEAGAEDREAPPERRTKAEADVKKMIAGFLAETGWHPARIKAVAGALLYTKYNFLLRFVMQRIAPHSGGSADTSKDHDYTDWQGIEDFADEFVRAIWTRRRNPSDNALSTYAPETARTRSA